MAVLSAAPLSIPDDRCLRRSVTVNVFTERGELVPELTAANFSGSFHHKPVNILSARQDGPPQRIVVVLDASGSMLGYGWKSYLEVLRMLANVVPPQTAIGLVVFSRTVEDSIPPTHDHSIIVQELEKCAAGSDAFPKALRSAIALWDSVNFVMSTFVPLQEGDALYLVTDGGDNRSKIDPGDLRRLLLQKGLRVFTLWIRNRELGPAPEERSGPIDLDNIVRDTGGTSLAIRRVGDAEPSLKGEAGKLTPEGSLVSFQLQQILKFYHLEIELPLAPTKNEGWSLKILGLAVPNPLLIFPRQIPACPTHHAH